MKRVFDLTLALLLVIIASPLYLITTLLVRIALGSPVLFVQTRPGRNGRPFKLYKFRTMHKSVESSGQPLPDAQRLSTFGIWLRRSSLDELPQLINVLKGDMSLVGPRPLLMEYLPLYTPYQARRHEVRPGITGWAQVNGRNAITWDEKFSYDVWYVDNRSLKLDLIILAKTLIKVLVRDGINQQGSVTAEPFRGSQIHHEGNGVET